MGTKNRYDGLDSLKALLAFLVVCIHAPFAGTFGEYFEDICSLAVPCFFMISGFFYPNCIAKKGETKQIVKIAKLTFISLAAYFIWTWAFYRWTGQDFSYITGRLLSFNGMVKLLVFNNVNFGYHLWYLLAFLYVLVIVLVARKLKLKKLLFISIPFLLLVSIAIGKYAAVFVGRFISLDFGRNAYFLGLPFFCMGWLISENFETIKQKLSQKLLLVLVFIFAAMGPLEHFVLELLGKNMEGDVYFSTPFFAACVFIYFAAYSRGNKALAKVGREFSTGIYIIHVAVMEAVYDIVSKTPFVSVYVKLTALFVFFISLAIVFAYKKLRAKAVKQ